MAKKDSNKEKKNKNFGKELKAELKKVSWPTFKQLVNNTTAVVSIVLIVAAIVFVLDVCFEGLNDFGVGKLKELVSSGTDNAEVIENNDAENVEEAIDNATNPTENGEENTNTDVSSEAEVVE